MKRKQPFSHKEFKSIYSKVPRLTIEIVVLTSQGILLTLRKTKAWKNKWHIPGGTVLYKETLEQAVKRIAKEELNVNVKIKKLLGYIEYSSEEKERGFGWSIGIAFLCEIKSGKLLPTKEAKFFKKLPKNIIEEQKKFLKEVL